MIPLLPKKPYFKILVRGALFGPNGSFVYVANTEQFAHATLT